jgi:chromosome segregation ATPase
MFKSLFFITLLGTSCVLRANAEVGKLPTSVPVLQEQLTQSQDRAKHALEESVGLKNRVLVLTRQLKDATRREAEAETAYAEAASLAASSQLAAQRLSEQTLLEGKQAELTQLRGRHSAEQSEALDLIQRKNDQLDGIRADFALKTAEVTRLTAELGEAGVSLSQAEANLSDLQIIHQQTSSLLVATQEDNIALQSQLTATLAVFDQLTIEEREAQASIVTLQSSLSETGAALKQQQELYTQASNRISQLSRTQSSTQSEYEASQAQLEAQLAATSEAFDQVTLEARALRVDLGVSQDALSEVQAQLASLQATEATQLEASNASLAAVTAEAELAQDNLSTVRAELAGLRELEAQTLNVEVAESATQIETLTAQLVTTQKALEDATTISQAAKQDAHLAQKASNQELITLKSRIESMQQLAAVSGQSLEEALAEQGASQTSTSQVAAELLQSQAEVVTLKSDIDRLSEQYAKAQEELLASRLIAEGQVDEGVAVTAAQSQLDELTVVLNQLNQEYAQSQAQGSSVEADLSAQIIGLQAEIETLANNQVARTSEIAELNSSLQLYKGKLSEVQAEFATQRESQLAQAQSAPVVSAPASTPVRAAVKTTPPTSDVAAPAQTLIRSVFQDL